MEQQLFSSILFALAAFTAGAQPNAGMYEYIRHPQPGDSVCAKDLAKAEREIAAGNLHLIHFADPKKPAPRYLQELQQIGTELQLPVVIYSGSSFMVRGQRRGCYAYRMDAEIGARFGERFNDSLLEVADRRFIGRHRFDTLNAAVCDQQAMPPDREQFDPLQVNVAVPSELAKALAPYDTRKPNLVLECVVDTTGALVAIDLTDELPLTNFPGAHAGDLLKLARAHLLNTGSWEPARLGNYPVASRVFIAIYFAPPSEGDKGEDSRKSVNDFSRSER